TMMTFGPGVSDITAANRINGPNDSSIAIDPLFEVGGVTIPTARIPATTQDVVDRIASPFRRTMKVSHTTSDRHALPQRPRRLAPSDQARFDDERRIRARSARTRPHAGPRLRACSGHAQREAAWNEPPLLPRLGLRRGVDFACVERRLCRRGT